MPTYAYAHAQRAESGLNGGRQLLKRRLRNALNAGEKNELGSREVRSVRKNAEAFHDVVGER